MESAFSGVLEAVLNKRNKPELKVSLLEEIELIKLRLETVSSHFESQSDPDLVEACIYEMKSLSARYRYLLKEARSQGLTKNMDNILEHTTRP
ncbi:MAG TPA: DUF2508 family protein [Ruminiclostridium sp.]|nr:DUF2508 family protein [Ruminiclostridium sp.]